MVILFFKYSSMLFIISYALIGPHYAKCNNVILNVEINFFSKSHDDLENNIMIFMTFKLKHN